MEVIRLPHRKGCSTLLGLNTSVAGGVAYGHVHLPNMIKPSLKKNCGEQLWLGREVQYMLLLAHTAFCVGRLGPVGCDTVCFKDRARVFLLYDICGRYSVEISAMYFNPCTLHEVQYVYAAPITFNARAPCTHVMYPSKPYPCTYRTRTHVPIVPVPMYLSYVPMCPSYRTT